MNNLMMKKWKNQISKVLLIVMLATLLVPVLPSLNGFEDNRAVAAEVYSESKLATKAVQNNESIFKKGELLGAYDTYILKKADVDVTTWVYGGKKLSDNIIELSDEMIADPNKKITTSWGSIANAYSAKGIAQEYIAIKCLGETTKATQLLDILKARQNVAGDGSFDKNVFSDMPAFEALGRVGDINKIDTAKAIEYIIGKQDNGTWGSSYGPDFQTTAQAVRSLIYLKEYASDKNTVQTAIDKGINWIKTKQNDDGSFKNGDLDDPVIDASEVIYILKLLNEDLNSWTKNGKGPVDYMKNNALNDNGSFGSNGNKMDNTWALDAYLMMGGVGDFIDKKDTSYLATKAVQNNESIFKKGELLEAYDTYILKKADVDVTTWVYGGKKLSDNIIELSGEMIADPNKKITTSWGSIANAYSAKGIAQEYIAIKSLGETTKAIQLLDILKARQNVAGDGSFDKNVFSDMPAFEALGRAGDISKIDTAKAIGYIIGKQDNGTWGSSYGPDFQTTAQAVRSLIYLKEYASDKNTVQIAIDKGINWIKTKQNDDGSFKNGDWDDPVIDTSEVIYILKLLNEDLNSWTKNGKGPVDYMKNNALNDKGTFGTKGNKMDNTWALDAYLMMGGIVNINDGGGNTDTGGNTDVEGKKVSLSIKGRNGMILPEMEVELKNNDTVFRVMKRVLDSHGISYNITSGDYFESIDGQVAKAKGYENSGWLFNINGTTAGSGSDSIDLYGGERIEFFYTLDYTKDSRNTGGAGDVDTPKTEINSKEASKADQAKLDEAIKKTGIAKLDIKESKDGKGYLSLNTISDLAKDDKGLTIANKGIELTFASKSLMTEEFNKALEDKNTTLAIGAKEVSEKDRKDIIAKASVGTKTGLFEIGGKIVDLSVQIIHTDDTGKATKEKKIDRFNEPVKVTIDLSDAKLNKEDINNLTGIRYEKDEKGNIVPKKLGGSYDLKTKTFTFYTDQFSLYGVLKAKDLVKINLQIDKPNITVNNEEKLMDVSPTIINGRTMVPLRFIGENMGADVNWLGETKTVEIMLDDKKLSLVIGEKVEGLDASATIVRNRTLVPIRYVSEYFDANVLWHSSTKKVEIVK